MRIPTTVRYATRLLVQLSRHDGLVSREELAQLEDLSKPYIYKIFHQLKAAGIVDGRQGRSGGYFLAKPAESISVADVYQALEGALQLSPCGDKECERKQDCPTTDFWRSVSATLHNEMAAKMIADLAADVVQLPEPKTQSKHKN
jgi:Rrf2 family protein